MSFSNYLEAKLLDHVVGKTSFTMPTAYIALSTANPTEDGSGLTEPVGNGYARVTTSGATWNAAAAGAIDNASAITFPTASGGSWGTITHFAIMDAASGGNMLAYGALTVSKVVGDGDTAQFNATDLDITLD